MDTPLRRDLVELNILASVGGNEICEIGCLDQVYQQPVNSSRVAC